MKRIYPFGYQGFDLAEIDRLIRDESATLVDIRFNPWSPNPRYRSAAFKARFGDRYRVLKSLGNELYNVGGMRIHNFPNGEAELRRLEGPAILMCACKTAENCHRTVVGRMLEEIGEFDIQELGPIA